MSKNDRSTEDLRAWLAGAAVGLLLLAALVAAYHFGFDRGHASAVASKTAVKATIAKPAHKQSAAVGPGKALFTANCGSCHTLAAAGTKGAVGPNLDAIKPDASRVLSALQNGGTGSGTMPKNLLTGKQARQVADFVSSSAGQ